MFGCGFVLQDLLFVHEADANGHEDRRDRATMGKTKARVVNRGFLMVEKICNARVIQNRDVVNVNICLQYFRIGNCST